MNQIYIIEFERRDFSGLQEINHYEGIYPKYYLSQDEVLEAIEGLMADEVARGAIRRGNTILYKDATLRFRFISLVR